jgi:hypothetical protein
VWRVAPRASPATSWPPSWFFCQSVSVCVRHWTDLQIAHSECCPDLFQSVEEMPLDENWHIFVPVTILSAALLGLAYKAEADKKFRKWVLRILACHACGMLLTRCSQAFRQEEGPPARPLGPSVRFTRVSCA